MISLVIISLVVAAFTPVITKKMQNKAASSSQTPGETDDETIAELKAKTGDMFLPFDAISTKKSGKTDDGAEYKCENVKTDTTTKARTITCKVKIPSDHVSIVMVGAGGAGADATTGVSRGFGRYHSLAIPNNISKLSVTIKGPRGYDGGMMYKIEPEVDQSTKTIQQCPEGTVEVTTVYGNQFCVTKYNVRPADYNDYHYNMAEGKTKLSQNETQAMQKEIKVNLSENSLLTDSNTNAEYTYIKENKSPACWVSPLTNCPSGASADGYTYCGRTVCNWYGADILCKNLALGDNSCSDDGINFNKSCKGKWRLMSYQEAFRPLNKSDFRPDGYDYFGDSSYLHNIVLHNSYPIVSSATQNTFDTCNGCNPVVNTCEGTSDSSCNSRMAWAASNNDETAHDFYTYGKTFGNSPISQRKVNAEPSPKENAYSTRCVLQKAKGEPRYTHNTGGDGAFGATITFTIPDDITNYCSTKGGCNFSITPTNDYRSGDNDYYLLPNQFYTPPLTSHANNSSTAYIKSVSGDILWGYKVFPGGTGETATLEGPGKGGKKGITCARYDTTTSDWSEEFECETEKDAKVSLASDGKDGERKFVREKFDGEIYKSYLFDFPRIWTSNWTPETILKDAYQTYWYSMEHGLYYYIIRPGAAGGGGGGGAFVHVKNIPIKANEEYEINIGGGGFTPQMYPHGTDSSKRISTNGGDTVFKFDSENKLIAHGGIAAKKGTAPVYNSSTSNAIQGIGAQGGNFETKINLTEINNILNDDTKTIKSNGGNGLNGTLDKEHISSIGGNGGLSGISLSAKVALNSSVCGGLVNHDTYGCFNKNNTNAMSPQALYKLNAPVKHIFLDGNYGSYGGGGGGGASKYENTFIIGESSAGQDGYIYFYWNK